MKHIYYAKKQRQLRHLAKQLKALSADSRQQMGQELDALLRKAKALVRDLSQVLAPYRLKKILGPAALLLGVSFGAQVSAQSFAPPIENPFGLISTNVYAFPAFADLDNDGDMDLMVGEATNYSGTLQYFKNVGTASNPQFAPPVEAPFGLTLGDNYFFPTFADLDNDGDMDLLAGDDYGKFQYFKNTGTPASPQFGASTSNPFGLTSSSSYFAIPTFVDLDHDGDLDMMAGSDGGQLQYYKNKGTPSAPQFESPQSDPFGLNIDTDVPFPAFADLDGDGDQDLLLGEYYGSFAYYKNIGSPTNPQFSAPQQNPFGLVITEELACPAFADLDNDGDMDLLVGEYYGSMQYFKNTSPLGTSQVYANLPLELFPNPATDILNIQTEMPFERIEVYDGTGRLVKTVLGNTGSLSLNGWNSGTYLMKFMDNEGRYLARKVWKE